jgi:hypothetical protein
MREGDNLGRELLGLDKTVLRRLQMVVKKGWNSLSLFSGGIPMPLSRTLTSTLSSKSRARRQPPSLAATLSEAI